jgi:hypothetical protein
LDVVGSSRVYSSTAGLNTAKFGASRAGDYVFLDGLCSPLASNGYSIFGMRAYSSLASAGVQVGGSEWVHEGAGTDNKSYYTISTHSGTALAERMRIDSSGNVGIGTTTPYIYSQGGKMFTVSNAATNGYAYATLAGSGTGGGELDFGNQTIRHGAIASLTGSSLAFYTNSTNSGAAVTEKARIDSSGNLLVGTTTATPSAPFSGGIAAGVFRTIYASGAVATGASSTLFTITVDSAYMVTVQTQNASGLSTTAIVRYVTGGNPVATTTLYADNGAFAVTVSGTAVRITNNLGGTVAYAANIIRIF